MKVAVVGAALLRRLATRAPPPLRARVCHPRRRRPRRSVRSRRMRRCHLPRHPNSSARPRLDRFGYRTPLGPSMPLIKYVYIVRVRWKAVIRQGYSGRSPHACAQASVTHPSAPPCGGCGGVAIVVIGGVCLDARLGSLSVNSWFMAALGWSYKRQAGINDHEHMGGSSCSYRGLGFGSGLRLGLRLTLMT